MAEVGIGFVVIAIGVVRCATTGGRVAGSALMQSSLDEGVGWKDVGDGFFRTTAWSFA